MSESITPEDEDRMDEHVDPTALNEFDIERELNTGRSEKDGSSLGENLEGGAADAFAQRLSQRREPVRAEARQELRDNISEPGANGKRQLYGKDPSSGQNKFVGTASNVELEVRGDGTVLGRNSNTGTTVEVGSVDLSRRGR